MGELELCGHLLNNDLRPATGKAGRHVKGHGLEFHSNGAERGALSYRVIRQRNELLQGYVCWIRTDSILESLIDSELSKINSERCSNINVIYVRSYHEKRF
jgi:hypothetical protein